MIRREAVINQSKRSGVVLVAVLIVVVLLSLAAYQYSELMTAEYRAADSTARATQARALAISGVHFAAANLADANTLRNTLNSNPYDNDAAFRAMIVHTDDRPKFQGRFSVIAPPLVDDAISGSTATKFGVADESSKININALVALDSSGQVAHDVLMKLPNMTEEIADAIIDWIDADDEQRPNGAENTSYSAQTPSYRCKNGPLDSLEELMLVRGVTPELLFGNDKNRNGMADADEVGANGFDPGWLAYLTVYSREINRDSETQPRIFLNDNDLQGLYDKLNTAVGEELANWILAYRINGPASSTSGGNTTPGGTLSKSQLNLSGSARRRISSIYELVDATVGIQQSGGGGSGGTTTIVISAVTVGGGNITMTQTTQSSDVAGGGGGRGGGGGGGGTTTTTRTYPSPLQDPTKLGQLLPTLLDKCTTRKDAEIPARVNVNTAPQAVLACLPGLEDSDVQTILSNRPTPGNYDPTDMTYQTSAWLLTQAKLPISKLRALDRYITGTTQTYRVQSMGYFDEGGPAARVEAVIDTNGGQPRIVYFRELTELGRGFEIPR